MSSPFAGMDPFIEACKLWGDFHQSLIAEIKNSLARTAPDRYLVRAEEREYIELIESDEKKRKRFVPDVKITGPIRRKKDRHRNGTVAMLETVASDGSVLMRAFIEEQFRESFVEIYEVEPERRLVTCIEVLSPENKRKGSNGWDVYRRKRQSLMLGDVNLVEIDLLRRGQRMPMADSWPNSPYSILVARSGRGGLCNVWPAYSLQRLSPFPVPLAEPDADLSLDLQPMIDEIYRLSKYSRSIDYRNKIDPPLHADEAASLKKHLRSRKMTP
jgi:hypothetical protein